MPEPTPSLHQSLNWAVVTSHAVHLDLERFGPQQEEAVSKEQARMWCRELSGRHYENFSVLSVFVPKRLRDDFAAVYCFCRWADDLGDEVGDTQKALHLLAWWRAELNRCYEGQARHPVFVALSETLKRHELTHSHFDDLIRAFEQDQTKDRYETWDQLINYCRLSANPVGRLVLELMGETPTSAKLEASDAICTALQLTNHWQDVKRDILKRDRIYIPNDVNDVRDFESRLRTSAGQGYACDATFLPASRKVIRTCVERTWPMFEQSEQLLHMVSAEARPIIRLFVAGGVHILRTIELWNYETTIHRPRLSRLKKLSLIAQAYITTKLGLSQRTAP